MISARAPGQLKWMNRNCVRVVFDYCIALRGAFDRTRIFTPFDELAGIGWDNDQSFINGRMASPAVHNFDC